MNCDPPPSPWRIALADPDYGPDEEAAVVDVVRSGWLTMGPRVAEFERAFAGRLGVRHAVALANGTDALLLALLALGIGPGDGVAQPAVNFVAAANATVRVGARPVFVDIVAPDEPTLDPDDLDRKLVPGVRAVIVMHYGGAACRMAPIAELCRARGAALIEDACHAPGAVCGGRALGAWGDAAAFSFFSNKNLAIGEGGMLTTEHDDVAERVRLLRSHGMTALTWDRHRGHAARYDVQLHGLNARLDELRAALGLVQLAKLDRANARRRALARLYHRLWHEQAAAASGRGWRLPPLGVEGDESAHHLMIALAPDGAARDRARERLAARGIQTSVHYPFIPDFSAFRASLGEGAGAAVARSRDFCARALTLPLHPRLTDADVGEVVAALVEAAEAGA